MTALPAQPLVLLGVYFIAAFPFLGNALAYGSGLPRRMPQAGFFLVGIALVYSSEIQKGLKRAWPTLIERGLPRKLLLASLVVIVVGAWNLASLGVSPSGLALIKLMLVCGWVFLFVLLALSSREVWTTVREPRASPLTGRRLFSYLLAAIGTAIMIEAWLVGPTSGPRDAHLELGGSSTYFGIGSVIGYFATLFSFPFPVSLLASAPFAYLFVFATSRTSYFVAVVLYAAYFGAQVRQAGGLGWVGLRVAAVRVSLAGLVLVGVVAPVTLGSSYYPYYSARKDPEAARARAEEIFLRFTRLVRVVPVFRPPERTDEPARTPKLAPQTDRERFKAHIAEAIRFKDDRPELFKLSLRLSLDRITGYWPMEFPVISSSSVPYPHNFVLEVAILFGWPIALFCLLGQCTVAGFSFFQVVVGKDPVSELIGLSLVVHLIRMQFGGDLTDSVGIMILCGLLLLRALRAAELRTETVT